MTSHYISSYTSFPGREMLPTFSIIDTSKSQKKNWYPWEKVQVDIPSYDVEDKEGKTTSSGTYLIPFVWNKRLLISSHSS
ncbi:hypothetical protein FM036_45010 [Nostoc sp. HG1]|nr:hypothetical protein [Nostoc sp. HG1]